MSNVTTLEQLDKEEASSLVGNAVFIIIMMIMGFMGNLVILIIYGFRMKPSNHRTFIVFLGAMDMCITTLGMSFFVVRFFRPLTHATTAFCKMLFFLNYYFTLASSQALLLIAVERYRKVCLPFRRQISRTLAKILCAAVLCIALIVAWPPTALVGITSIHVKSAGVTINFCAIEENLKTVWVFYHGFLFIYLIATFIVLAVSYTLIWRVANKYVDFSDSTGRSTRTTSMELSSSNVELEPGKEIRNTQRIAVSREHDRNFKNRIRMAMIFFLITVIFVCSYIPHLIIEICLSAGVFRNLSAVEVTVLDFLQSIAYISNVTNCYVYGCFDVRFRCQIKALLGFCKKSPTCIEEVR